MYVSFKASWRYRRRCAIHLGTNLIVFPAMPTTPTCDQVPCHLWECVRLPSTGLMFSFKNKHKSNVTHSEPAEVSDECQRERWHTHPLPRWSGRRRSCRARTPPSLSLATARVAERRATPPHPRSLLPFPLVALPLTAAGLQAVAAMPPAPAALPPLLLPAPHPAPHPARSCQTKGFRVQRSCPPPPTEACARHRPGHCVSARRVLPRHSRDDSPQPPHDFATPPRRRRRLRLYCPVGSSSHRCQSPSFVVPQARFRGATDPPPHLPRDSPPRSFHAAAPRVRARVRRRESARRRVRRARWLPRRWRALALRPRRLRTTRSWQRLPTGSAARRPRRPSRTTRVVPRVPPLRVAAPPRHLPHAAQQA
mmetsp:Transcript_7459/g.16912  ORF Transcript_7459/g.16912 Transcript_7459/m.16912 type:complete len:366 (-) Transcript_7459:486-1583(-)